MVDSVKSGREVKEDKGGHFLLVGGYEKIIVDAEKGGFCGVVFTESGLEDWD